MADKQGGEAQAARLAAVIYLGIASLVALAFFVGASVLGRHTATAIYGGTAWVFLLTLIVSMPLVIPFVRARVKGAEPPEW